MTSPDPVPALFLAEIVVTDWPGAVRWYVATLGLRPAFEDPARRYALLEAGPGRVALKGGGEPGRPRDGVRLVFEVADVDATRERLARLGESVGPPEASDEGYRAIRLRDPEGTPITLFCWNEGGPRLSPPPEKTPGPDSHEQPS